MQAQPLRFREAKRIQQSFLAALEKKTLLWLAAHTPRWINSDHLTLLGLLAMAGAGAGYWWANVNRMGLIVVIVCLALNWLGDSLDGTLARFRNCCRPRYGFYVDHIVDAFSAFFLLGGLALSGYMAPAVALGLLIGYLMLSIEVYLANPIVHVAGHAVQLFSLGGTIGIAGMVTILLISATKNTVKLYRREPLPVAGTRTAETHFEKGGAAKNFLHASRK